MLVSTRLLVPVTLLMLGACTQSPVVFENEQTETPQVDDDFVPTFAPNQFDLLYEAPAPVEPEPWDVGVADVIYSNGLLPSQDLFDWYAETEFYADRNEVPSPTLAAHTLWWEDEGTLQAEAWEWTIHATFVDSPVAIDPAEVVEFVSIYSTHVDALDEPYYMTHEETIEVTGSTVRLENIELEPSIGYEEVDFFTPVVRARLLPNTTDQEILISIIPSAIVNPTLAETGQEVQVEYGEYTPLVFRHLPTE